jgi:hypothetical protein
MPVIVVPVVASLFDLEFTIGSSTGTDLDTRPGIGVALVPNATCGRIATPTEAALLAEMRPGGVIGREAAAKLRDELEIFLKNHAAGTMTA